MHNFDSFFSFLSKKKEKTKNLYVATLQNGEILSVSKVIKNLKSAIANFNLKFGLFYEK